MSVPELFPLEESAQLDKIEHLRSIITEVGILMRSFKNRRPAATLGQALLSLQIAENILLSMELKSVEKNV